MAKWPKDSPGTWYSHYKRGSLVSGPACGRQSPGSGLDSARLKALHGSGFSQVCTCTGTFACWFCGGVHDRALSCTHLQSGKHRRCSNGENGGEVCGPCRQDLQKKKKKRTSPDGVLKTTPLFKSWLYILLCYIKGASPKSDCVPRHSDDSGSYSIIHTRLI